MSDSKQIDRVNRLRGSDSEDRSNGRSMMASRRRRHRTAANSSRERRTPLPILRSLVFLPILASPIVAKDRAIPNNLFTLSGFEVRFADTPERLAVLKSFPANKIVARNRGGKNYFVYAEPNGCVCAFVGTPDAYARYRNGGVASSYGSIDPTSPTLVERMMDDIRPDDSASAAMDYIFGPGR